MKSTPTLESDVALRGEVKALLLADLVGVTLRLLGADCCRRILDVIRWSSADSREVYEEDLTMFILLAEFDGCILDLNS